MGSQYGGEIYSQKMTRIELNNIYKDNIQFVSRSGKSDIILLNDINAILTEAWYEDRRSDPADEAERLDTVDSSVPEILKVFIGELINNPLKQASLSQAIFSGARTGSVLPLQFGLAVAADIHCFKVAQHSTVSSRICYQLRWGDDSFRIV